MHSVQSHFYKHTNINGLHSAIYKYYCRNYVTIGLSITLEFLGRILKICVPLKTGMNTLH